MREGSSVYLPPGTRLGKYELVRMLAVGGMAEIHLARATGIEGFEKLVVLKRILPQLAADEEFTRMFIDEARLAARLHHPNVVEVFDIGVTGGSYFFTMEYVRGEDLSSVIMTAARSGKGISLENALAVVIGVAEGLHHAHEMRGADGKSLGLVHRDVSPTNVLLTYDGGVKVCDFGIAKAFARQGRLTEGVVKGKASYMSPEQCRGEPLDRRSDVFAIGILLYELTTGKRLFRGASDWDVLQQIAERDVPAPSSRVDDYPAALEPVVMRALCRDRERRFATAQELQLALEEVAREDKLLVSSAMLGRYMHELFADKIAELASGSSPDLKALGPELAVTVAGKRPTPTVDATPTPAGEPSVVRERAKGGRSALLIGAALVAAAAGGYVLATRSQARAPAVPAAAAPAAAAAAAAADAAPVAAPVAAPAAAADAAPVAAPAAAADAAPAPAAVKPVKKKPVKPPPPPDDGPPPLQ